MINLKSFDTSFSLFPFYLSPNNNKKNKTGICWIFCICSLWHLNKVWKYWDHCFLSVKHLYVLLYPVCCLDVFYPVERDSGTSFEVKEYFSSFLSQQLILPQFTQHVFLDASLMKFSVSGSFLIFRAGGQ